MCIHCIHCIKLQHNFGHEAGKCEQREKDKLSRRLSRGSIEQDYQGEEGELSKVGRVSIVSRENIMSSVSQ